MQYYVENKKKINIKVLPKNVLAENEVRFIFVLLC